MRLPHILANVGLTPTPQNWKLAEVLSALHEAVYERRSCLLQIDDVPFVMRIFDEVLKLRGDTRDASPSLPRDGDL
jgi:hypothetical protein